MPEPITPERLAEIQDRTHNATPGPWGVGNRTEIALDAKQDGPGCFSYTVKLATVIEDDDRQDDVYYLNPTTQPRAVASAEDDALFIAHARQDVEDLLAEVDRLNATVNLLGSQLQGGAQAARDLARVIDVVALEIRRAVRLANAGDHVAAMRVITEWASEADWLDNLDDEENFARPSAPTAEGGEPRG